MQAYDGQAFFFFLRFIFHHCCPVSFLTDCGSEPQRSSSHSGIFLDLEETESAERTDRWRRH